jgi:hypothetical protein
VKRFISWALLGLRFCGLFDAIMRIRQKNQRTTVIAFHKGIWILFFKLREKILRFLKLPRPVWATLILFLHKCYLRYGGSTVFLTNLNLLCLLWATCALSYVLENLQWMETAWGGSSFVVTAPIAICKSFPVS